MRRSVGVRVSETELGPSRRWRAFVQSSLSLAAARITSRGRWTHKSAQARTAAASSAYRDIVGGSLLRPPEPTGLMAVRARETGFGGGGNWDSWECTTVCRPRRVDAGREVDARSHQTDGFPVEVRLFSSNNTNKCTPPRSNPRRATAPCPCPSSGACTCEPVYL